VIQAGDTISGDFAEGGGSDRLTSPHSDTSAAQLQLCLVRATTIPEVVQDFIVVSNDPTLAWSYL
jgi:hypothetical protein